MNAENMMSIPTSLTGKVAAESFVEDVVLA
jgi:hypothetical protein